MLLNRAARRLLRRQRGASLSPQLIANHPAVLNILAWQRQSAGRCAQGTSSGNAQTSPSAAPDSILAANISTSPPTPSKQTSTSTNPAHRTIIERERTRRPAIDSESILDKVPPPRPDKGKQREEPLTSTSPDTTVEGEWLSAKSKTVPSTTADATTIGTRGSSAQTHAGPSFFKVNDGAATCAGPIATKSVDATPDDSDQGVPTLSYAPLNIPIMAQVRHPFNTNRFVSSLERTGEFSRTQAEELMKATKALLTAVENDVLRGLVAKTEMENEAYLFSAALSELRTEVQMTARTDSIALRALNSRLQREVDSLMQRLKEDVDTLRHNNQIDVNNRKEEASGDITSVDQRIIDMNSKFMLVIGDMRAQLEANKWIQTRRAIVMIAGLAIVVMAFVSTAPAPAPASPPRPPSIEELGLKPVEGGEPAESGLFGWFGGSANGSSKRDGPSPVLSTPPRI